MATPLELLRPKRLDAMVADGVKVTVVPPASTGFSASSIVLTDDQFRRYREWLDGNALIQDALPELSPAEREILVTGIGPEEWNAEFADDMDDDTSGGLS